MAHDAVGVGPIAATIGEAENSPVADEDAEREFNVICVMELTGERDQIARKRRGVADPLEPHPVEVFGEAFHASSPHRLSGAERGFVVFDSGERVRVAEMLDAIGREMSAIALTPFKWPFEIFADNRLSGLRSN